MKTNAPNKIYTDENGNNPLLKRHCDSDIEYTRTDVFIEKTCNYLQKNLWKVVYEDADFRQRFVTDFKNYMKGE